MRLCEIKWEGDGVSTLDDLALWGLKPMVMLLDYMDMVIEDEMDAPEDFTSTKMLNIRNELLDKVIDVEATIERFIHEIRGFDKPEALKKKDSENEKTEGEEV